MYIVLVYTLFFPYDRSLHSAKLLRSRGVAASDFRPLRKIPHCCLPQESGPYLSPSVADHPLRPATDHCHGSHLPYHLANQTQAHPVAKAEASFDFSILYGISPIFTRLFQSTGQVAYALLTRSPVYLYPKIRSPQTCMCQARRQRSS